MWYNGVENKRQVELYVRHRRGRIHRDNNSRADSIRTEQTAGSGTGIGQGVAGISQGASGINGDADGRRAGQNGKSGRNQKSLRQSTADG